ncbi:UNVERIFIED_CONTAM: hypothetical protein FKN15_010134 [Acipenser sinensis]
MHRTQYRKSSDRCSVLDNTSLFYYGSTSESSMQKEEERPFQLLFEAASCKCATLARWRILWIIRVKPGLRQATQRRKGRG